MSQEDKPVAEVLSTQVEAWQREVSALQEKIAFAIGKPVAAQEPAMSQEDKLCSQHPDAPHGFDRNASHNAGRYVCECEGWEPVAAQEPETESFVQTVPDHCDRIVWKGTYIHLPIANAAPCAELQAKITEQAALIEKMDIENTSCRVRIGTLNAQLTTQSDRIQALEAEAADRESFLKTLADTCTEAERIAIERAGRIDAMESECRKLRDALSETEAFCKRKDITIERQRKVIEDVKQFINTPISVESCARMNATIAELEKGVV